jgi:hypothetical protein
VIVPTESPLRVPPPPFVTLTACDTGSLPASIAVKLTLVVPSTIAGGSAEMVNVTITVWGLLVATPDVTGTVAV